MDSSHTEITVPITEAAADALGVPVEALPPLFEAVNLDAVDRVVTDDPSRDVVVTFPYAGLHVLVRSGNTVYVRPRSDPEANPVGH